MNAVIDGPVHSVAQELTVSSDQPNPKARVSDSALKSPHRSDLEAVESFMRDQVEQACPTVLGSMVSEHMATGGKRLRARLALRTSLALGVQPRDAVAWAAAVELLHNATLVHDDLQDGDRLRRGQPTVWARHGSAQAINVGDFMLMMPTACLQEIQDPCHRGLLAVELSKYALRTVRGQAIEMTLLPNDRLDRESYQEAIRGKTGALLALPVLGAALLAGGSLKEAYALADSFERLGVLFQLQDDVCDLYGHKGRDCIGSDLYEGKVSALVVEHLRREPSDKEWLTSLLKAPRDETAAADVTRAIEEFRRSGALATVINEIRQLELEMKSDAALQRVPEVRQVALSLCVAATKSIRHLYVQKTRHVDAGIHEEKCA